MTYQPRPLDTSKIVLPPELLRLQERLAENTHDLWARQRFAEGWTWGAKRDDEQKRHPCLVHYHELPESEKEYDRLVAMETLRAIMATGHEISPARGQENTSQQAGLSYDQQSVEELIALMRRGRGLAGEFALLADAWRRRSTEDSAWRTSPEPYRYLGKRLLELGESPLAKEVACAGLENPLWGKDVDLRLIVGAACARTASPEQAQFVLKELHEELVRNKLGSAHETVLQETLGLLARTYKDQAIVAHDEFARVRLWSQSRTLYEQAYRLTGDYWTGINVATLARLNGDEPCAREVGEAVRVECRSLLNQLPAGHEDRYWVLAALGEASLVLGEFAEAESWYRAAWQATPRAYGNLISTRRNARWLMAHGDRDPAILDDWLPIPKVVVFAGHMLDRPGRPKERFPERMADAVGASIRAWLGEQQALIGFSSAACGADILFQEALLEVGGEGHVVLPYEPAAFEADSVRVFQDSRDDAWGARFHWVLERATQVVIASPQKMEFGGISYDYANLLLHGLATARAAQMDHAPLLGLAVWDGARGDGPGGTACVVANWHKVGLPVHPIAPSLARKDFGTTLSVARGRAPAPNVVDPGDESRETRVMAMLFADAINFSKLTEEQVPRFVQHFLAPLADIIHSRFEHAAVVRNTWGDGLYLVFNNVGDAGRCALAICQYVTQRVERREWAALGLPEGLNVRIALHAGPVFGCRDPVTGHYTYTGTHVSRAARLEPKTPPGQVYASEAFAALSALQPIDAFHCEYVKQLQWAKNYGTFPTYVLVQHRGSSE